MFLSKTTLCAYRKQVASFSTGDHVLRRKVTEHDGQCEHRPIWRNEDGTVTGRKRDA